jgi:hypothetical protein
VYPDRSYYIALLSYAEKGLKIVTLRNRSEVLRPVEGIFVAFFWELKNFWFFLKKSLSQKSLRKKSSKKNQKKRATLTVNFL